MTMSLMQCAECCTHKMGIYPRHHSSELRCLSRANQSPRIMQHWPIGSTCTYCEIEIVKRKPSPYDLKPSPNQAMQVQVQNTLQNLSGNSQFWRLGVKYPTAQLKKSWPPYFMLKGKISSKQTLSSTVSAHKRPKEKPESLKPLLFSFPRFFENFPDS